MVPMAGQYSRLKLSASFQVVSRCLGFECLRVLSEVLTKFEAAHDAFLPCSEQPNRCKLMEVSACNSGKVTGGGNALCL